MSILALLSLTPVWVVLGSWQPLQSDWVGSVCTEDEAFPVNLSAFWAEARDDEPGYLAREAGIAAEEAFRSSIRREWVPQFSIDGLGNWGQRLSPGEERVLGVGPRGDLRIMSAWTLFDENRRWRALEGDARTREARFEAEAFDLDYRAELARMYVEASVAEAVAQLRVEQLEALEQLAVPVQQRMDAGVDIRWEGHLLDDALARARRQFTEATQARSGLRNELSFLLNRCVHAVMIDPVLSRPEVSVVGSPDIERLLGMAESREALARVEGSREGWQLQMLGIVGPTRSRAFANDPVELEYLVGLSATWTPDISGRRAQAAAADRARASALRADAESQRVLLQRETDRIAADLDFASRRATELDFERTQAERRLEIAVARWEAGVDRWAEVVQGLDRVNEVRLLQIDLLREVGMAWIRVHEIRGDLGELPARLEGGN